MNKSKLPNLSSRLLQPASVKSALLTCVWLIVVSGRDCNLQVWTMVEWIGQSEHPRYNRRHVAAPTAVGDQ